MGSEPAAKRRRLSPDVNTSEVTHPEDPSAKSATASPTHPVTGLQDFSSSENDSDTSDSPDSEDTDGGSDSSDLGDDGDEDLPEVLLPQATGSTGSPPVDLKSRLAAFMPMMKAANDDLLRLREDGRLADLMMDNVEEGDPHIEMDLGLGVFEEKTGESSADSSDDDDEDHDDDIEVNDKAEQHLHAPAEAGPPKHQEVLRKLMGQPKAKRKAGIEEVEEPHPSDST